MTMHRRYRVALVGGALSVLIALGSQAGAQSVPMPVPAPHTKPQAKLRPPMTAAPTQAPKPSEILAAKRIAQTSAAAAMPAPAAVVAGGKSGGLARIAAAGNLDGNQRALVERVSTYLTGLNTLVGNFVQVGPDGSRTEGQFYLQKPGRVRFEYNPPSPLLLVADGSSVAIRDRKLGTQDLLQLSQTPLRFLVADRIDLMKDTTVIGASADDTFATIVIEERQVLGGTHRLMLMFGARDFQLRQWTITDPQGYDTTVALYNLDAKQKPDPNLFKIDYTRYIQ
jgi:outer membrane lipoprotein-sorting protein